MIPAPASRLLLTLAMSASLGSLAACGPNQPPLPSAHAATQQPPPQPPSAPSSPTPPTFPPASGPASGPASNPIR
jgi:hypothetical protein